jgi:hypothetical protein
VLAIRLLSRRSCQKFIEAAKENPDRADQLMQVAKALQGIADSQASGPPLLDMNQPPVGAKPLASVSKMFHYLRAAMREQLEPGNVGPLKAVIILSVGFTSLTLSGWTAALAITGHPAALLYNIIFSAVILLYDTLTFVVYISFMVWITYSVWDIAS